MRDIMLLLIHTNVMKEMKESVSGRHLLLFLSAFLRVTVAHNWFEIYFRITKPLTFADCVGDELPLGWEEVYDQQVGVYYIDHINSEYIALSLHGNSDGGMNTK